jgi:hypothetical protein
MWFTIEIIWRYLAMFGVLCPFPVLVFSEGDSAMRLHGHPLVVYPGPNMLCFKMFQHEFMWWLGWWFRGSGRLMFFSSIFEVTWCRWP